MLAPLLIVLAAAPAPAEPSARALRVAAPLQLDGVLDEPAWALAGAAAGFRQREPKEGEPATEATEVRVLYDDATLYVGVRAFDREPQRVIARILQRDRLFGSGFDGRAVWAGDDGVAVLLDPFHDHRNAFVFATNANGAEYDALVTDESPALNVDWRGLWRVAARRTPEGWSAEFAIPFRTLRYPAGDAQRPWGINVARLVRRKSEETLWSGWARGEGGLHRVSLAGHLDGLVGLPRSRLNLEVKPYGLAGATRELQDDGTLEDARQASVGLDLKWEMRPGLVLDATVNPDFAQVESDEQIVNLTRFDLFLPEKRDFFLENAGIFDFGTRGLFEPPPFQLFFSRQIGIKEDEGEVPVMGGVRLSGRVGRQTVGLLGVVQDAAFGDPRTGFSVLRVKRDLGERGYLGAMVADRRTQSDAETDGGFDFSLKPSDQLNLSGFAAWTSASAERGADLAYGAAFEYRSDRVWTIVQHMQVGPDAETAMGFVTRTDIRRSQGIAQYTFRPTALALRSTELFAGGNWATRVSGEQQDGTGFAGGSLEWDSGDTLTGFVSGGFTELDEEFELADRLPVPVGRYDVRELTILARSSQSRPLGGSAVASFTRQWGGRVDTVSLAGRVAGGMHFSAGPTWTWSRAELPSGAFTANVVGLRAGWAFSVRLNATAYLQYNSLESKWITNLRLHFIHRPGSDLYVVWNDDQGEEGAPGRLVGRGLAVKGTWLVRF